MAVIHLLVLLAALLALHHVTYYAVPLSTLFLLAPVFALLTAFASIPVTVALGLLGDRVVASSSNDDNDDHRRRRTRLQRALRPLVFATPAAWSIVQVRDRWEMEQAAAAAARVAAAALSSSIADATMLTTDPPSPTTISAGAEGGGLPAILRAPLDNILARILGDFVHPWYDRLSPSPAFPRALDSVLREAGASFLAQMTANKDKEGGGGEKSLDLATLVVATLVPRLTRHLAAFARAERALLKAGGGVVGPGGAATTSNGVGSAAGGTGGGRGRASSSVVDPLLLARSYDDDTRLHRAVSSRSLETRPAQEEHLRMLADIVLRRVLPERERKSSAVRIIAREIVAVAVLAPVVEMLSDPDFWNRMLDEQAGNYIREQNLVHQLRAALEATSSSVTSPQKSLSTTTHSGSTSRGSISSRTDAKSFESFVRAIGRVDSLLDVRRLRSDLGAEIRRTKGLLEGIQARGGVGPAGETAAELRTHLERLYLARGKTESRIAKLSGGGGGGGDDGARLGGVGVVKAGGEGGAGGGGATTGSSDDRRQDEAARHGRRQPAAAVGGALALLSSGGGIGIGSSANTLAQQSHLVTTHRPVELLAILTSPGSLSYYMEFMERRGKLLLLQFWLTVESFKEPLEDVDLDEDAGSLHGSLMTEVADDANNDADGGDEAGEEEEEEDLDDDDELATAREDLRGVWESYFEDEAVLGSDVARRYGPAIRQFIQPHHRLRHQRQRKSLKNRREVDKLALARARRSMFLAQRRVYEDLREDYYPSFQRSDLFFQATANLAADARGTTASRPTVVTMVARPPVRDEGSAAAYHVSKREAGGAGEDVTPKRPKPPAFPHRETVMPLVFDLPSKDSFSTTASRGGAGNPAFSPLSSTTATGGGGGGLLGDLRHPPQLKGSSTQLSLGQPSFERRISRGSGGGGSEDSDLRIHSPTVAPPQSLGRSRTWTEPGVSSATVDKSTHLDFLLGGSSGSSNGERRAPLFDDHVAEQVHTSIANAPAFDSDEDEYIQIERLDAIQAALTSIIARDQSSGGSAPGAGLSFSSTSASGQSATTARRQHSPSSSAPVETAVANTAKRSSQSYQSTSQTSMTRSVDSLLPPPGCNSGVEAAGLSMSASTSRLERAYSEMPPLTVATLETAPGVAPARRRVFEDDDEDEDVRGGNGHHQHPTHLHHPAGHQSDEDDAEESIQLASVGDLQLPIKIARLGEKLAHLQSQEPILDALIRKAELTGNDSELQLLTKSHSGLLREIRALSFQKAQYESQERDNRLDPARTRIGIPTSATSSDDHGRQVVRYLVEVQQLARDGSDGALGRSSSGWVVARRYNDFFALHAALRERIPAVRALTLPGKMLVSAMSASFVDSRRMALEKYLQSLLSISAACSSLELRAFLSQQTLSPNSDDPDGAGGGDDDLRRTGGSGGILSQTTSAAGGYLPHKIVKHVYRLATTGLLDDLGSGPSMLDVIGQRLTRQAGDLASFAGLSGPYEQIPAVPAQHALRPIGGSAPPHMVDLPVELKPLEGETAASYFTGPICDLFVEIFELRDSNNWLRRQAIVIILQQILGSTIERKLREVTKNLTSPLAILKYLTSFTNIMWPNGQRRPPSVPRTEEQKLKTKEDAYLKLSALMPDVAANMIGRRNARRGAKRLFAVLQNPRLNAHLVHTILDEVVYELFPEERP